MMIDNKVEKKLHATLVTVITICAFRFYAILFVRLIGAIVMPITTTFYTDAFAICTCKFIFLAFLFFMTAYRLVFTIRAMYVTVTPK